MKKIILIIFICLLTGCGTKDPSKTLRIELDANVTTGYFWTYSMSSDDVIKNSFNKYIAKGNSSEMIANGGIQIYEFVGLKEGNVTITFTYQQPPEAEEGLNNLSQSGKIYQIEVDKDLKIKVKSIEKFIS